MPVRYCYCYTAISNAFVVASLPQAGKVRAPQADKLESINICIVIVYYFNDCDYYLYIIIIIISITSSMIIIISGFSGLQCVSSSGW